MKVAKSVIVKCLPQEARAFGVRVNINARTAYGGLANRSGLHQCVDTALAERWQRSGALFLKKLEHLEPGDHVQIFEFQNTIRGMGRWVLTADWEVVP
jgi:hypothetical protein